MQNIKLNGRDRPHAAYLTIYGLRPNQLFQDRMQSNKYTAALFSLTDTISRLLVVISISVVVLLPFNQFASVFLNHIANQSLAIALECTATFIHGLGFLLLLKRKIYGFALVFISGLVFIVVTSSILAVSYLGLIFALYCVPWVMSYKQMAKANET